MDGIWMALRKDDYNMAIRRFVATRVGCSERYAYGLSSLKMHSSTFKLLLWICCLCDGLSALVSRNKSVWNCVRECLSRLCMHGAHEGY
jgi:hypothetical protein